MPDHIYEMGEFFDSVARDYDRVQLSNIDDGEQYYKELAYLFPYTSEPLTLLDLGAGTGLDLVEIFARAPDIQVDCLDLSKDLLTKLEARFHERHVRCTVASYHDFEFPANYYDFVLASATLHHFTSEEKLPLFKRIRETLKPYGTLVIGDFYVNKDVSMMFREHYESIAESGKDVSLGRYHLDIPTTYETEIEILGRAGFHDVFLYWRSENYAVLGANVESFMPTTRKNLDLKHLRHEEIPEVYALIQANKVHLTRHGDFEDLVALTLEELRNSLDKMGKHDELFVMKIDERIIGTVSLINYAPRVFGLGYWISEEYASQGLMKSAVQAVVDLAVEGRGAIEVWAGIRPHNVRSIGLVRSSGFEIARSQDTHESYVFRKYSDPTSR